MTRLIRRFALPLLSMVVTLILPVSVHAGTVASYPVQRLLRHQSGGTPLRQVDWASVLTSDPNLQTGNECVPFPLLALDKPICITVAVTPPVAVNSLSGVVDSFSGYAVIGDGVMYGDIDGDGVDEAVIETQSGGTGGSFGFLIYHQASPRPRLVAAAPGYKLGVRIDSGTIVVRQPFYFGFEGNCCPTGLTDTGYRLIAGALTATYGPNYSLLYPDSERPATPAEITVAAFYRALSTHDFDAAYSLLSPAYQGAHPFSSWKAGYANTKDIEADVDVGNAPGEVTVAITATDRTPTGGRTVSSFAGSWFTVPDANAPLGVLLDHAVIGVV
jgi:hypothetical protein